ncbi:MAG: DHH family phosphoesterase [Syntrophus sp. (in: bacteria)]|nr:DHH family phosphoesterase [Syntrophus sp. (in: bacteria)]
MFTKIKQIIDEGNRFLITTHIDPDGDAIGSAFSLYWALDALNKRPLVYLKDPIPYKYEFLPIPPNFTRELPTDRYDGIFVLDCGNLFRVGPGHEQLKEMGPLVNIDHHTTNETFGLINMIDARACSTAEILCALYESLDITLSLDMAINIYTAILTDTGSFRFENTNSNAFIICDKMVRAGVKPEYVSRMVYNSHPKERFLLLGMVLATLTTYANDTIAMVHVTEDMFRKTTGTREMSDGFVELVKEIRGTEVAILLREIPTGYKVSMRSMGSIDVARICNLFGGGGHKNAAGCTIPGSLNEADKRVKEALGIS